MADFKISANVEVRKQAPWDDRITKPTKADLINPDSWASDNGTYYVYKYMVVGTADGLFMLTDVNKLLNTDYSGWLKIGESSGGSSSTGDGLSEQEVQALIDAAIAQVEGKIPTDYLTEVPSEYITETELEERLSSFTPGGGDGTGGATDAQIQALQAAINAEVERAKGVEELLTQRITEETTNSNAAYTSIDNKFTKMVDDEETRATQAEEALQGSIDAEKERAEDAEKVLSDAIAEVEGKIPTKTSQLENDSNFLTEHQSLDNLATKEELNSKQDVIEDLDVIREGSQRAIPTKVSELENDKGYLTEHQDISHLVTSEDIAGMAEDTAQAKANSEAALTQSNQAKVNADAALTTSNVAIESIKSLQGLSDADEAMVEIANQIV